MDHLKQAVRTVHLRKNGVMEEEHLATLMKLKRKDGTSHHAEEMTGPGFRKEEMWEAITTLETALASKVEECDGLREVSLEFLEATQLLLDWMNGCDMSADHHAEQPEDFKRLSTALKRSQAALTPTEKPVAALTADQEEK